VCPHFWYPTRGQVTMNTVTSFPSQAYDYVNGNYGTIGVIIAGVAIVLAAVSVMIWFDRRK
jgi:hypothetical protein